MQILIAPNAFKNSLSAADTADAIKEGLLESNLNCTCHSFPVGDGGDGTAELILQHFNGVSITTEVHDPLGRKIFSSLGLIDDGKTAVIEMANASGLRLLKSTELDPMHASSFGTGELIKHALNNGVTKIILCIGGSATIDGATGILRALGIHFLNKSGEELGNLPETLVDLDAIDFSAMDERMVKCKLVVLCDVENFLLGKDGAANVFGPQKGAGLSEIIKLEVALTRFRDIVLHQMNKDMAVIKHGGAAGGVAAGLAALLNAELVNGIEYFLMLTSFEKALKKTNIVITGEGSIDIQTLQGKGPFGVAKMAKQKNIPVIGLAGQIPSAIPAELEKYFDVLLSINNELVDISRAMAHTSQNLKRTGRLIGNLLALKE